MNLPGVYAAGLALLGAWGVFSGAQTWKRARQWSGLRRRLFVVGMVFTFSCFACAGGLWLGRFRAWLLVPLGLSFLGMIPLPCYFRAVDERRWAHAARNVLFAAVALFCLLLGFGVMPLSLIGL
jgi:hypothetical protein